MITRLLAVIKFQLHVMCIWREDLVTLRTGWSRPTEQEVVLGDGAFQLIGKRFWQTLTARRWLVYRLPTEMCFYLLWMWQFNHVCMQLSYLDFHLLSCSVSLKALVASNVSAGRSSWSNSGVIFQRDFETYINEFLRRVACLGGFQLLCYFFIVSLFLYWYFIYYIHAPE